MIHKTGIGSFLPLHGHFPVLDVRSPGEYQQAHIPGAYSFPLFSDEERKIVGTAYKMEGREKAIKIGLDYFGVKMSAMVEAAEQIIANHKSESVPADDLPENTVLVHCWRGGMRSAGVAWLLDLYGFNVYMLSGGYKAFRHWVLQQFSKPYSFNLIGGYTGSGKTGIITELQKRGFPAIDLEDIAHHKGSAFGALGETKQPTQEMFENELAFTLDHVLVKFPSHPIWIEDESRRIGQVHLPDVFYQVMKQSAIYFIDMPFEERLSHITASYGRFETADLIEAISRIQKRLGGLNAKNAISHLHENNLTESFRILLHYYDKYYRKELQQREDATIKQLIINCDKVDTKINIGILLAQKILAS